MGSLRNPIGPLPSSIYWRRRAVALTLLALLAMLVAWAVSFGDGGSGTGDDGKPGAGPAPSITPGDEPSGPAISERPGGRDEADGGASSGNTGGDGGGGTGAPDGGAEGEEGTGKNGDGDPSASGGLRVPANSPLPNCASGALKLTLRSAKISYALGEKPRFELIARNTSAVTCKADFGPKAAVLTVTDDADDAVWSTKDCPQGGGSVLLSVPANSTVSHFVDWDRRPSAPAKCATPPAGQARPGTYLVEASFPGAKIVPASFRLEKD
ncbi:hypothetical protein V1460_34075 [Streptomyces sp. SCSIO 30461]|uniref:hypothetical protein n=1 Tax=Streptomyces sp. SCSIO 30461 TaxID=3118085 RepID=UPI0030CAF159